MPVPTACDRCRNMAARLSYLQGLNLQGQLDEPEWPPLAREIDAALQQLLACPGEGRPGCVAREADQVAAVASAAHAAPARRHPIQPSSGGAEPPPPAATAST